jgi:hypothetical protein
MKTIIISVGDLTLDAELNTSETARQIYEALPLEGSVNLWGDEIYFDIPLSIELEDEARASVNIGDLGYWPAGPAFCIFYGRTPVSTDGLPRAYSPVNVFGKITGDATQLTAVPNGSTIRIDQKG